jgi:cyanophycinase
MDLGMVPRHVSVQIDNYESATNLFTVEGYQNLLWLGQADVIYFNGGDQSRHVRCWFNDNGTPNPLFSVVRQRVLSNKVIIVGVSAGTAVQSKYTYGGGSSFGILYFTNNPGLAPLPIEYKDGLEDTRNGTDCLQYSENGAYLQGFGFVDFQVDTHFDRRGRLGRLIPAMTQLNQTIGIGID